MPLLPLTPLRHPCLDVLAPQGESQGAALPFSVLSLDAAPTTTTAPTLLGVPGLLEWLGIEGGICDIRGGKHLNCPCHMILFLIQA